MKTRGCRSERGAILIQVAVALLALLAFSAFVIDYGVMWVSRNQAQNAADAAALSGAMSLAFEDPGDFEAARVKARALALENAVWGAAPDVTLADITFPACPPTPGWPPDTCVKADVFRNQRAGGKPLPVFFANLVGIANQGVRATATARILQGDATDCMKPWAVPDKWLDLWDDGAADPTPDWTYDDAFEKYFDKGTAKGTPLPTPDYYRPPYYPDTTGFNPVDDFGTEMVLKFGNPSGSEPISPGWFFPVDLPRASGPITGGDKYRENIYSCPSIPVAVASADEDCDVRDVADDHSRGCLDTEPGAMIGPTIQGFKDLLAQDPGARWVDPDGAGPQPGYPDLSASCAATLSCPGGRPGWSPRLVALALFDVDMYLEGKASGKTKLKVVNILGFFVSHMRGQDVVGYLTHYPSIATGRAPLDPSAAFLSSVILVR